MKILASDFDKTIYISDEAALKRNILSTHNFLKKGNIFIIITGRSYFDIKPLLTKHNIKYSYLICEDGAKIYNNLDYAINTINLSKTKVEEIINIIPQKQKYYLDDGYNYTTNTSDCVKIAIPYQEKSSVKTLLTSLSTIHDIYYYLSKEYINITAKDANKKEALQILLNLEQFNEKDLYVIGDDINDLEMLKSYQGILMTDHNQELDNLNLPTYKYLYEYIEELESR